MAIRALLEEESTVAPRFAPNDVKALIAAFEAACERKRTLAVVLRVKAGTGIRFNDHCDDLPADIVFRHACKLGFEGIVSKRLGSPYRSGRSRDWLKMKNPNAPAVKREAEEDWAR